ncbi:MAG: cell division protein ZapE [Povalibacter sp.]
MTAEGQQTITTLDSVAQLYELECRRLGYQPDPIQQGIVARLDELRSRLLVPKSKSVLTGLFSRKPHELERGLYLWGGVGRGKTWLMDLFFQSLPFKAKQRSHFHRFMQSVHDELRKHKDRADPLELVAEKIARKARVLCFDELFVSDIGDAMLLGNLFRGLFDRGVTLVATSNVAPDDLYKEGLQRARFVPAIRLLKENTQVVHVDNGVDYRLRALEQAPMAFDAADSKSPSAMAKLFEAIAGEPGTPNANLTLNHRRLHTKRLAAKAVWFDFKELCDGPRGQSDYIEIARCFQAVLVSDIPVLTQTQEDQARRFVSLVDEFYDRGIKLIISSAALVNELYKGTKLKFEFERTSSRLIEMQSQEYLARPHRC